ncbi:flagellar protein D [Paenibacillus sp. MY03]|jgi:flagellar protein FlbD|uniref:Flagellar protein D n=1 Tax=Paenibacillus agaridevorans TaxID=171404 RepID=A0A2R5F1G8_9BACL|nr:MULTISPECIES: flagellar FlbD family protein [Paenibacillus]OUS71593.1 flagellar protein D [Paenibacillus sp. MY03]QNK54765.1 flagellar FlbD family protein [Paenibacillus sp. PAMC21692]GBG09601.1 flagellar protein D [Paenibacillus agaridevorans]
MITVTRLNGTKVVINALLIELIEEAADTVITLTTGKKLVVKEKSSELLLLNQQFLQTIGLVAAAQKSDQTEGPTS